MNVTWSAVVVLAAALVGARLVLLLGLDAMHLARILGGEAAGAATPATSLAQVRRVKWSANTSLKDLARIGEPVVLEDSPARKWACASWTEESIQSALEILPGVKRQNQSRVFRYYHETKPLRDLPEVPQHPFWTRGDMRTASFFARIRQQAGPPFLYFSTDLESFPGLRKDLPRRSQVFQTRANAQNLLVNMWMAGDGIIADTHYDTSDNLYFQIRQRKRFVLVPPSARDQLGVYPFLHPFYRRAVRPLRTKTTGPIDDQLVQSLGGMEAVLGPGDLLFLPAFWFHNVEAIAEASRAAISINLWYDSMDYTVGEEVFTSPVPFEEDWDDDEIVQGLHAYSELILSSLAPSERRHVVETLRSQYGVPEPPTSQERAVHCDRGDEAFRESLSRGVDVLAFNLGRFSKADLRTMYVGYFIEVLANFCVGTENVKTFIDNCLFPEAA